MHRSLQPNPQRLSRLGSGPFVCMQNLGSCTWSVQFASTFTLWIHFCVKNWQKSNSNYEVGYKSPFPSLKKINREIRQLNSLGSAVTLSSLGKGTVKSCADVLVVCLPRKWGTSQVRQVFFLAMPSTTSKLREGNPGSVNENEELNRRHLLSWIKHAPENLK